MMEQNVKMSKEEKEKTDQQTISQEEVPENESYTFKAVEWLNLQIYAVLIVAVLIAFLGTVLLRDIPIAAKIEEAILPIILLAWTTCVIYGVDVRLEKIRFDIYWLAVSKNPLISKESIAELYSIPKKQVERDFRLVQKYNIYPASQLQVEEELEEEPEEFPIIDSCIGRLKVLNEKISNRALHHAVEELVQVSEPQCDSYAAEHLMDFYLPRVESLLDRYVKIGVDTPEGYEDLLKLVLTVTEDFKQTKDMKRQQEEMDFSAEVSAVLQSASMNATNTVYSDAEDRDNC